jgi:hypothetical protein
MAKGNGRDGQCEARWRRIIQEQERSGLSVRAFCRRGQVHESAFYFWRRELQRRQGEPGAHGRSQRPPMPAFVPVRVTGQPAPAVPGPIVIELSGGRRVHVTGPVDRAGLVDVLAVLALDSSAGTGEGRPC